MNATKSGGALNQALSLGKLTREPLNYPIHVGEITGEQLYELVELVFEPERWQ